MKKLQYHILISLVGLLLGSSLSADEALTKQSERYLEKTRTATGDLTESASKGEHVEDRVGGNFDNFMDTVIWNDTFRKRTDNIRHIQVAVSGKESIALDSPVDRLKAEWDAEEARLATLKGAESNQTKENPTFFAGGYCTFEETLSISKSNVYGKLDCLLDFGHGDYRKAEVFAGFYPDYKREMVMAIPIYITFEDDSRATFSGIVLKANKTSMNLAGWVDNKRIQKMAAEGLLMTNELVYNYVDGYMQALYASRNSETIIYPQYGDGNGTPNLYGYGYGYPSPERVNNVAPPEARDYVISAGIKLLSGIFSIVGEDYLYATEPLFAVYPQKVYVEGMVSFDNQGLARRFGQISKNRQNRANSNNNAWRGRKNRIINRYNRRPATQVNIPTKVRRESIRSKIIKR